MTYVNKKKERITQPLNSAMESSNSEMSKRLRYTKDILTHMQTGGQETTSPSSVLKNNENNKDPNR